MGSSIRHSHGQRRSLRKGAQLPIQKVQDQLHSDIWLQLARKWNSRTTAFRRTTIVTQSYGRRRDEMGGSITFGFLGRTDYSQAAAGCFALLCNYGDASNTTVGHRRSDVSITTEIGRASGRERGYVWVEAA